MNAPGFDAAPLVRNDFWEFVGDAAGWSHLARVVDQVQAESAELARLANTGDLDRLRELAHRLKGPALTIGAMALGGELIRIEAAARAGDQPSALAAVAAVPGRLAALSSMLG
jgi:HPt (histidine-containing phosphotransfer) domain-containing protein